MAWATVQTGLVPYGAPRHASPRPGQSLAVRSQVPSGGRAVVGARSPRRQTVRSPALRPIGLDAPARRIPANGEDASVTWGPGRARWRAFHWIRYAVLPACRPRPNSSWWAWRRRGLQSVSDWENGTLRHRGSALQVRRPAAPAADPRRGGDRGRGWPHQRLSLVPPAARTTSTGPRPAPSRRQAVGSVQRRPGEQGPVLALAWARDQRGGVPRRLRCRARRVRAGVSCAGRRPGLGPARRRAGQQLSVRARGPCRRGHGLVGTQR